ncbi:hypothetical protein ID853_13505 [Xenorhabdus sp. Vera]|uniref:hypothetical protein n=1 Tax=Xenorhabdus koppenhoeferi TaxID=351659 RepID=UPI0019838D14|nr:hypothetical protein [Xenorhabdus sp. Vera]MBD2811876.1 hypothetical protein [Xenorhabdus sp. Vera]
MNNDVIEFEKEINELQIKAADAMGALWIIERQLLTLAIINFLLEKGDNEEALIWMEGILDCLEEDLSSEIENNEHDLDGWIAKRLENEVSPAAALDIIRAEMPTVEEFKQSWIETRNKLAKYENMEPVAWKCLLTGELYSEPPKLEGTQYLALLYCHPKK